MLVLATIDRFTYEIASSFAWDNSKRGMAFTTAVERSVANVLASCYTYSWTIFVSSPTLGILPLVVTRDPCLLISVITTCMSFMGPSATKFRYDRVC